MLMTDDTGWNDFGAYSGGGATLGHPTGSPLNPTFFRNPGCARGTIGRR